MGIVDPHCRADFTDEQINRFAEKIGKAGIDYVRVFTGWEPTDFRESPFLRTGDGRWDLYKPNLAYDVLTRRFQRALSMAGVGILWDISGQQFNREDYTWSFFNRTHNIQGIDVYDYDAKGIEFWKALTDRIIALIGIEGNRIGLGNEQQAPGDFGGTFDKAKVYAWARGWSRVLVDHLLARGVALPYSFSASRWTGKELYNRVCKFDNGELNPARPWSMMIEHIHGLAMPEHFAHYLINLGGEQRLSVQKHYGISDDGVDGGGWNDVPEDKRGPCGPPHLTKPKCTAGWQYRLELVKAVNEYLGGRLRDIEFMPRELKGLQWDIDDLDQIQSVDIWPKIGEVYGADIRRS